MCSTQTLGQASGIGWDAVSNQMQLVEEHRPLGSAHIMQARHRRARADAQQLAEKIGYRLVRAGRELAFELGGCCGNPPNNDLVFLGHLLKLQSALDIIRDAAGDAEREGSG